ncbi:hypothetical protein GBAR_LOCUS10154 [Geodia barretti]|uniref:Uncharacterized protein n=1 Tax=Geodia barretti TaxID=519541 RepID=A0AA35RSR5_GEOBA|nr:hypothetical protein GBAR_LOCUS10154 [Geodia barretti]
MSVRPRNDTIYPTGDEVLDITYTSNTKRTFLMEG